MSEIIERKTGGRGRSFAWLAGAALLLAAAAAVSGSLTQAAAAPAITVFVGYADSERAGGEFPNPWNGGANVTFDGCAPQSACVFDGGAIRVRNDNATSISVSGLSVHIGACLYTWSGPRYPVSLAPGASLITAQRGSGVGSGCTGPDPVTFDSSDIPSTGDCSNDGIQATVDVTVDGSTSSYTDSGQVMNTGGVDPGLCTNSDESAQWVRIGSKPCPGQTLSLVPVAQTDPVLATATVSAVLTDSCGNPLDDVMVAFKVSTGPNAGEAGSGVTDTAGTATFSYSSSLAGTDSLLASVTNAVGFTRSSNTAAVTWIVMFAPGGGSFVIGNNDAVLGSKVNFWGSQWAWHNSLTGGLAPRSFKGYADQPVTPACGQSWASEPGNSTPPPDGPLPELMGVIVTSASHKTGPELSGDIVGIVVVRTDPGYAPNPGHAGTGTVTQIICGTAAQAATTSTQRPQHPASPPNRPHGPGASTPAPASAAAVACQVIARSKTVSLPPQACARKAR